jgi:hypothetical protein
MIRHEKPRGTRAQDHIAIYCSLCRFRGRRRPERVRVPFTGPPRDESRTTAGPKIRKAKREALAGADGWIEVPGASTAFLRMPVHACPICAEQLHTFRRFTTPEAIDELRHRAEAAGHVRKWYDALPHWGEGIKWEEVDK